MAGVVGHLSRAARVLERVRETRVVLDRVKALTVTYGREGAGQAGARFFVKKYVPILRYHNPHMRVSLVRAPEDVDPSLKLTVDGVDGSQRKELPVRAKATDEIWNELLDVAGVAVADRPKPFTY